MRHLFFPCMCVLVLCRTQRLNALVSFDLISHFPLEHSRSGYMYSLGAQPFCKKQAAQS